MKIYNSLTKQKEEFVTIKENEAKIYACGPTVYNYIHIGNARPICVFDTLRKYLEFKGYKVNFVQNFTDVDDKIINKANQEGVSSTDISEKFIEEYKKDATGLSVSPATNHPKVTENISEIIELVKTTIEKGYGYQVGGDVYFRASKFEEYGKLSSMPLDDLKAGARIETGDIKENPMDFVLWKSAKAGEPFWESPWGKGRPGWHIECSALAKKYLGETIDIHCGGQDLIFPHHENEIAQSESANGVAFSHYWMHNGYINVDNKKMSKSIGNFFTTREVAEKFGYEPIRFMMIASHYRSPINYSLEIIEQSISALERLNNFSENLNFALSNAKDKVISKEQIKQLEDSRQKFIDAMEDDLNTADALASIYDLVREVNPYLSASEIESKEYLLEVRNLFDTLTEILGIKPKAKSNEIPQEVLDLVEKRKEAKANKDFALADEIRANVSTLGYTIEETRQGIKIVKNKN
jgi:cysteinyl-tRNA synthetase